MLGKVVDEEDDEGKERSERLLYGKRAWEATAVSTRCRCKSDGVGQRNGRREILGRLESRQEESGEEQQLLLFLVRTVSSAFPLHFTCQSGASHHRNKARGFGARA